MTSALGGPVTLEKAETSKSFLDFSLLSLYKGAMKSFVFPSLWRAFALFVRPGKAVAVTAKTLIDQGISYEEGSNLRPPDPVKAAELYQKAIDLSSRTGIRFRRFLLKDESKPALAQYRPGFLYEKGLGVPKDEARAAELYHQTAKQESASAQLKFGLFQD